MNGQRPGSPWTKEEIEAVIAPYFRMLEMQLVGESFSKADVRAGVAAAVPARTPKAIEFKWCNISAILDELGLPWVDGFKPLRNYQRSLRSAVEGWLVDSPFPIGSRGSEGSAT